MKPRYLQLNVSKATTMDVSTRYEAWIRIDLDLDIIYNYNDYLSLINN